MKVEFNGFGVEVTKEDFIELVECLKNPIIKAVDVIKESLPQKCTICLIDGRYDLTGYITEYGTIKISTKKFKDTLDNF